MELLSHIVSCVLYYYEENLQVEENSFDGTLPEGIGSLSNLRKSLSFRFPIWIIRSNHRV